jgi:protein kinase-like protein
VPEKSSDRDGSKTARKFIEGFELIRKLGEGGMGGVYLARQVSMDRMVALKVLRKTLSRDGDYVSRFIREARLAGKLDHENIVRAIGVGESNGYHYLIMDYVEGQNLYDLIPEDRGLKEHEALDLVLQVARALDYAHNHGIVHRDIKPDNVLIDNKGVAKLTDLGLARQVDAGTRLTQTGVTMGTPHYISPEQARGDRQVDIRSDIYSLGATLYHLVTGRPPFDGSSAAVIMTKHLTEQVPWPQDVNPDISKHCCLLIAKMMAKEPEDRYQTPAEVVEDLELVLEGEEPAIPLAATATSSIGQSGAIQVAPRPEMHFPRRRRKPGQYEEEETDSTGSLQAVRGGLRLSIPVLMIGAAVLLVVGGFAGVLLKGGQSSTARENELMQNARRAELNGEPARARNLFLKARALAPEGCANEREANRALIRIDKAMSNQQIKISVQTDWQVLVDLAARAEKSKTPRDFKELSAAYGRFIKKHPNSFMAPKAKVAMASCANRYIRAAAAEVQNFEAAAAKLTADFKFGQLRAEWDALAARYADAPAGKIAKRKTAAAGELALKALAAAKAAAEKAMAADKYDQVLAPLEALTKADINQLKSQASTLVAEYKQKIIAARRKLAVQDARRKSLAKCNAIRDQAVKLARAYDYVKAHGKFMEAQMSYGSAGFHAERAATKALANSYWSERALFSKLGDYSRAGGLKSASVKLADKLMARVVSASSSELTYRRRVRDEKTVPWQEVPLETVFSLLCRPKLTVDERVILVHFALNRGLFKEAKAQLDKVLLQEPKRKKELAPLEEAIQTEDTYRRWRRETRSLTRSTLALLSSRT